MMLRFVFTIGLVSVIVQYSVAYSATVSKCSYKAFAGEDLIRAVINVHGSNASVKTIVNVRNKDYIQQSDYNVIRNTEKGLYLARVQENLPNSRFDYRAMAVIIIDKKSKTMTMANIFASGSVEYTSGTCNISKK